MKIGGKNGRIVGERSGKRMEIRRIMMGYWREKRGKGGKGGKYEEKEEEEGRERK